MLLRSPGGEFKGDLHSILNTLEPFRKSIELALQELRRLIRLNQSAHRTVENLAKNTLTCADGEAQVGVIINAQPDHCMAAFWHQHGNQLCILSQWLKQKRGGSSSCPVNSPVFILLLPRVRRYAV